MRRLSTLAVMAAAIAWASPACAVKLTLERASPVKAQPTTKVERGSLEPMPGVTISDRGPMIRPPEPVLKRPKPAKSSKVQAAETVQARPAAAAPAAAAVAATSASVMTFDADVRDHGSSNACMIETR